MNDFQRIPLQSALSRKTFRLGLALVLGAAGLALALYAFYGWRQTGGSGFPLDDTWIHLQIARNLASGDGWSFNPGEPTGAATAPLWVAMLASLFALPGDETVWVKVLGCALFITDVLLVADVARLFTGDRRVAIVAGLLAAWQPAFLWAAFSGMETLLFLLLFLLSLRNIALAETGGAGAAYAATFWLTLAGWARPELWAMLPVIWGYFVLRRRQLGFGRWWVHAVIALMGIGGFALFNLRLWGHPLPSTLAAKTAHLQGVEQTGLIVWLVQFGGRLLVNLEVALWSQNSLLISCLALGGVVIWRRSEAQRWRWVLLVAVVLAANAAAAAANLGNLGFQTYRRAAHVLAAMNVLVAVGLVALDDAVGMVWQRPGGRAWWRAGGAVMVGVVLVAVAMQAYTLRNWGKAYANDVRSINQGDVAAGVWLVANTPADALVAANDIGAITYFGQRRLLDLIGLASPETIPVLSQTPVESIERDRRLLELLRAEGADYVVIFPKWFPYLAQDPALVEVQRFVVPEVSALAADTVVVYRLAAAP